jgi:cysteine-rich repeat protein
MHFRTALAYIPSTVLGFALISAMALGPACSSEDVSRNTGGTGGSGGPACNRDGVADPGEMCDDANDDDTDGCTKACRFTCQVDAECLDSSFCNGPERCDVEAHTCLPSTGALPDRTLCGENQICAAGVCTDLPNQCGDSIVYVGEEECDDGDAVNRDGCESDCTFSCMATLDERNCKGLDPCGGTWSCDDATHQCRAGTQLPDGQACGANKTCRGGVCADRLCGNNTREGAEECDDGNTIQLDGCENDCRFTCSADDPQRDCKITDACAGESTCDATHQCSEPQPAADGTECGSSFGFECRDGACIDTRFCGNGTIDPGEDCDDENTDDADGCKKNCRYSCGTALDCNDKDPCNGPERCDAVAGGGGQVCKPGSPPVKGTPCGTDKICINSSCGTSTCGDGYVDVSKNEQCDPPNAQSCSSSCQSTVTCDLDGTWALKIATEVTWPDSSPKIVIAGSGTILSWAKIQRTVSGSTATDEAVPCGLQIPDFAAEVPGVAREDYRLEFPHALFDANTLPSVTSSVALSAAAPGATFNSTANPVAIVLGAEGIPDINTADDLPPNPDIAQYVVDHDGDGVLGISAHVNPTVGATYSYVPVRAAPLTRADRIYLVVRQVSSFNGTIADCSTVSGDAIVTEQNSRIVGCHRLEDVDAGVSGECVDAERDFAERYKVVYSTGAATFSMKKLADGASCADVRGALP